MIASRGTGGDRRRVEADLVPNTRPRPGILPRRSPRVSTRAPRIWSAAGRARSTMAAMSSPANFAACVRPQVLTPDSWLRSRRAASTITPRSLHDVFARPALFLRRGDQESGLWAGRSSRRGDGGRTKRHFPDAALQRAWRNESGAALETTLDREARTLLQVKIKEGDDADDIFVKLMGDIVEPRREFIQENALNVANLECRASWLSGREDHAQPRHSKSPIPTRNGGAC